MPAPARVLILGIGNTLLTDEAVGVRAVEALQDAYDLPLEVQAVDAGTSSMDMLDAIADVDLLVVLDAVKAGKPLGTVLRLSGDEVPVFFRKKLSPHQVGLSDVLASLEFAGCRPKDIVVIGIEAENFALGLEMSPLIAARVPELVALVVGELASRGIMLMLKRKAA
jgi:hydrogenase maturation protease